MSPHGLALFCLVYLMAVATPGPGVTAVIARALGRGSPGMAAFIAGFVVGDLVWFALAATGLAALAQTAHAAFTVVRLAGAVYLAYLAYRLWTTRAEPFHEDTAAPSRDGALRPFFGGLSLTMGNPKVMVFFLALLPTVVDLTKLTVLNFLDVAVAMCAILSGVLSMYAFLAHRTRRLFKGARAVRWLNRGAGTALAGAAIIVATR